MSTNSGSTSVRRLDGPLEVDRIKPGRVVVEELVSPVRKPFLPGVTSEAYFGQGTPVLGVRVRGYSDGLPIAYRARRLTEVAESRAVAIVVMTDEAISSWERAGLRCEYVPYGAPEELEMEQDIVDLWGIDLVMNYDEALSID